MERANTPEKVSVNMNSSTLAQIDLLVDQGYYSNRSDFINQAVRESLARQQSTIDRIAETHTRKRAQNRPWFVGVFDVTRRDLEEMLAQGEKMEIRGFGLLCFDEACDEELLRQTVACIQVRGRVRCAPSARAFVDSLRQSGANAD